MGVRGLTPPRSSLTATALPSADLEIEMKLLRWAMAGASAYVVYKYTIGQKAKGEDVFKSPDGSDETPAPAAAKPKRTRRPKS
jgi:hypothetical protein